jgi:surface carbohydrate biosynthesis protein (TIGR04326 family)
MLVDDRDQSESSAGRILIWDAESVPDAGYDLAVLWRGFEDVNAGSFGERSQRGQRVVSISRLVEDGSDELRARYLAWVHALGETSVHGRTIAEHLLIRPNLSYWWMASPAQKFSISATSLVPDAIKMLALEKHLANENALTVVLHSSNARLAECLAAYCKGMRRRFDWQRPTLSEAVAPARNSVYRRLPPMLRAVISFGLFCVRRGPAVFAKSKRQAGMGSVSFFDVLVHLDKRALESGRFLSNYWGPLVDKLSGRNVLTNWFHHFYPHPAVPTFTFADRLVQRFRENSCGLQFHSLIDVLPSAKTALLAWRDYLHLIRAARAIDGFQSDVLPQESALNLWPLHQDEWAESIAGPNALMECLRLGLFEAALAKLPRQVVGVYICENQPWEISLIHAWRERGHGRLVAVPHSTVRYWDLRYFHDRRAYLSGKPSDMPLPDVYALNGPVAAAMVFEGGCPAEKIVEVEALRFMHLGRSSHSDTHGKSRHKVKTILICGDFLSTTNDRIFGWLQRRENDLPAGANFIFKPHPAFPYEPDAEFATRIGLHVDERSLGELLPECEIVITSAITSAAVDAYCAGTQVIQIPDGRGLNANALRGITGVRLAATSADLASALQEGGDSNAAVTKGSYFWLDASLQSWLAVLGIGQGAVDPQFSSVSGDR